MIISNLVGGLGNQMFQYAAGRYLSIKHKTKLKIHFTYALFCTKRKYDLDCFNIKINLVTNNDLKKINVYPNWFNKVLFIIENKFNIRLAPQIVSEKEGRFNQDFYNIPDNIYLQGYWQNEKYFQEIEKTIRKDFTFIKPINTKNKLLLKKILSTNSVSIHVRRGDYLKYKKFQICDLDYYNYAINKINHLVAQPFYFVFSDDIDWCKKYLGLIKNTYFSQNNKNHEDLRLMSLCKHHINANSSFSWWASWLNTNKNKIIIKPNKY